MYRYRRNYGVTIDATEKLFKHVSKIGELFEVRGYHHRGRYIVSEHAIMFKGTLGSIRVNGFCYGYFGEGTHGLRDALIRLGIDKATADHVSFYIPQSQLGIDWQLKKQDGKWVILNGR